MCSHLYRSSNPRCHKRKASFIAHLKQLIATILLSIYRDKYCTICAWNAGTDLQIMLELYVVFFMSELWIPHIFQNFKKPWTWYVLRATNTDNSPTKGRMRAALILNITLSSQISGNSTFIQQFIHGNSKMKYVRFKSLWWESTSELRTYLA